MLLYADTVEIEEVLTPLLDNLTATLTSQAGMEGADVRRQIGDIRAFYVTYIESGEFSAKMLAVFTSLYGLKVKLSSLAKVREALVSAALPDGLLAQAIMYQSIIFCLSTESRLISDMEFVSRDDVDKMIVTVRTAFEDARVVLADYDDSGPYQAVIALGGALVNHLATAARPLPRMVSFSFKAAYPALTLSHLIYYDTSRWEELLNENKIIHPAFCLRDVKGLSQ